MRLWLIHKCAAKPEASFLRRQPGESKVVPNTQIFTAAAFRSFPAQQSCPSLYQELATQPPALPSHLVGTTRKCLMKGWCFLFLSDCVNLSINLGDAATCHFSGLRFGTGDTPLRLKFQAIIHRFHLDRAQTPRTA